MEKLWPVVLLCLSAVVVGSDQQHCSVPAPSDEDTDPCPSPQTNEVICDPKTCNTSLHIQYCMTYDPATKTQVVTD